MHKSSFVLKNKIPWNEFWHKAKNFNEEFLDVCETGDYARAKFLITHYKYYIQVNVPGLDNWTPLHNAAIEGHLSIIRLLIDNKANIECLSSINRTPLHLACLRGHLDIVRELIQN